MLEIIIKSQFKMKSLSKIKIHLKFNSSNIKDFSKINHIKIFLILLIKIIINQKLK